MSQRKASNQIVDQSPRWCASSIMPLYRIRTDIAHQVVQTAGHWLQLDHPDVVEKAIRDFLGKLGDIK